MWVSCHIRSLYFFLPILMRLSCQLFMSCSIVQWFFMVFRRGAHSDALWRGKMIGCGCISMKVESGTWIRHVTRSDATVTPGDTRWHEVTRCETTVLIRTVDYCTNQYHIKYINATVMERLWGGHVLRFFLNPFLVFPSSRFPNGSTLVPRLYFQFQRHHHENRSISNFKHSTITKSQPWDEKW